MESIKNGKYKSLYDQCDIKNITIDYMTKELN